ncbi:MAG: ribose-phosphate diphosphokinase [Gemmatimonadota bacterium]|nr:ribose-phosphate diphosphokinase [Gemmatimonadota bacterium]
MREIVMFGGTAHPELAENICSHVGVEPSRSTVNRFSNGCIQVQLEANCREADVFLIQPMVMPVHDHLMELLQMLDAARGASAARTTAVIPYFGYARSDKKDAPRISIAARLVADLLYTAGASRVLTMTLHAAQVHGFFSVPVDHLNALQILAGHFLDRDLDNTVVVSPDLGRAKEAAQFARMLKLPVAAGSKRRISDTEVVIDAIVGDVDDRKVIVLDDEVATGGTLVELIRRLRDRRVSEITIACTHGLFTSNALERFCAFDEVKEVVTTDTVPLPSSIQSQPNLVTLSVAPLLAEAVRRIHNGESVSSLFTEPEWIVEEDTRSS